MNIPELVRKHADKFINCSYDTILVIDNDIVIVQIPDSELNNLAVGDSYIVYDGESVGFNFKTQSKHIGIVCEINEIVYDMLENKIYFARQLA